MKVYVITEERGKLETLRFSIKAVIIANREFANRECARLNAESDRERLRLAQEEQERVHNITGQPHRMTLEQIAHELRSRVPHYEVEEKDGVFADEMISA